MSKNKSDRLDKGTLPKYASDRIIIKLKPEASLKITTAIPSMPVKYTTKAVTQFGLSALDKIASEVGVTSLRSIGRGLEKPFDPLSGGASTSGQDMQSEQHGLSRTFVVGLAKSSKLSTAISKFKGLDQVADTNYDYLRYTTLLPDDPRLGEQWGLVQINCPEAWERITEGDTTVAVVDTGVQRYHPDLRDNLLGGYDFVDIDPSTFELPPGYSWVGDVRRRDGIPADDNGHGTHVAGTIAAVTGNGKGVAGVAWSCTKILPVRVMASLRDPEGYILGTGTDSDITTGIRWAADHDADVINLSLGGPEDSPVWRDAISYAYSKNCAIVAAMGNEYLEGNPISYPAAYPNVLAVGAVDESGLRASFSNTGPHIDVVAPGVRILSTYLGGTYRSLNGTSMATPHVAGVAAMLKACNQSFSNVQIYNILRSTARELGGISFNDEYGHGIVDAEAALDRCSLSALSPASRDRPYFRMGKASCQKKGVRPGHIPEPTSRVSYFTGEDLDKVEQRLQEALDDVRILRQK